MTNEIRIEPLANHREHLPMIVQWFEREWPAHYGANGQADAEADLQSYARNTELPVGVMAFCDGEPCGVATLKRDSIPSRSHLTPWAGVEQIAREFGF